MPNVHLSTTAVLDESATPSVKAAAAMRLDVKAIIAETSRMMQQALTYQALVADALEDETFLGVHQKFAGLEGAISSVNTKGAKVLELIRSFRGAVIGLDEEMAELQQEVDRVNALAVAELAAEVRA